MTDGFAAIFWGIVTFSLLIVIHEGGHFAAARLFGIKVHEFMIGLPGPALRLHGKKTTYGITAIPLGGYVRIAGMDPGPEHPQLAAALAAVTRRGTANAFDLATDLAIEEAEADRLLVTLADWDALVPDENDEYTYTSRFDASEADDPRALLDRARSVTYRALSTWKRIVMLSAGVVLNLVTAIVVFTIVLAAFGDLRETTKISEVAKASAAAEAGMRSGDRMISIEGDTVANWREVVTKIGERKPGETIEVVVQRGGEELVLSPSLKAKPDSGGAVLGVMGPELEKVDVGLWTAFLLSFSYIGMVAQAIAGFFNPATFQATVEQSASIIGASYFAAQAAKSGAIDYARLVAALSLSLGVINIVPIPPLDGGKVAIEVLEHFRGRPLSRKVSLGLSAGGAVLLFALIGYLMYADVVRFIIN